MDRRVLSVGSRQYVPQRQVSMYERHVFVCTHGEWCPSVDGDGIGVHSALKAAVADAGLSGRVRINQSGCLNQCGNGPMAVVYPDDVWYGGLSPADADTLVREHLEAGRPVERLRFEPGTPGTHKLERDADGRPIGRTSPWPAGGKR